MSFTSHWMCSAALNEAFCFIWIAELILGGQAQFDALPKGHGRILKMTRMAFTNRRTWGDKPIRLNNPSHLSLIGLIEPQAVGTEGVVMVNCSSQPLSPSNLFTVSQQWNRRRG